MHYEQKNVRNAIPPLFVKMEEEMARDTERILRGEEPLPSSISKNAVTEVPDNFKQWVKENSSRIEKAKSLPYFLRDNTELVARLKRIEVNRKEYERIKANPDYGDVEFNPENGGLKAIHKYHERHINVDKKRLAFGDKTPWDLERECQDILYSNGYSCIFNSEKIINPETGKQAKALDATINGNPMDIASITSNGKTTIKNAIDKKKKQIREVNKLNGTNYNQMILHFHKPGYFDESKIRKGLGKTIKRFICAINSTPPKVIIIK